MPRSHLPAEENCRSCARLAAFRDRIQADHPAYWCKPVPAFGPVGARLLVVGLAPGLHGANASGRPFTGDHAGILLYKTLHRLGLASAPVSAGRDDGLTLRHCRIVNTVKCVPPQNRPLPEEIRQCAPYLQAELAQLPKDGVIMALGRVAHEAVVRAHDRRLRDHPFAHGARHELDGRSLFDSYHCSRYNTQTGRLTEEAFMAVFEAAQAARP
ncbi:MAG: uracil-DNA glycosylase [Gammaproteobacteria bacterium]|nr:uracil-DNA glycosylase [Gammaproteobacteria bacterium]